MLDGRCLCGDVRFGVDAPFAFFGHCHCSACRKHHGASFVTWLAARAERFEWRAGEECIGRYRSSEHMERCWCRLCGSSVPAVGIEGTVFAGAVDVPAGSVDAPLGETPRCHVFAASRAPWVEIRDGLPAHDGWADPSRRPPEVEPAPRATRPGCVSGSCLCGSVAFEVETTDNGAFYGMRNCHCRRCRLARGAAHATNLFTPPERVRFVRGADLVVDYALPEAERFGVAFCSRCGAHVARVLEGRPYAVVPAGALDEDPGIRPSGHIFDGSRAEWFLIADDLPRYQEYAPAP